MYLYLRSLWEHFYCNKQTSGQTLRQSFSHTLKRKGRESKKERERERDYISTVIHRFNSLALQLFKTGISLPPQTDISLLPQGLWEKKSNWVVKESGLFWDFPQRAKIGATVRTHRHCSLNASHIFSSVQSLFSKEQALGSKPQLLTQRQSSLKGLGGNTSIKPFFGKCEEH